MTSKTEEGRTTEIPNTDTTDDDGPWYKCSACDTCFNKRDLFLLHVSDHDHDQDGERAGGHGRKRAKIKLNPENKPIFHTPDG